MEAPHPTIEGEIDRYLLTGVSDPYHAACPGGFLERANRLTTTFAALWYAR